LLYRLNAYRIVSFVFNSRSIREVSQEAGPVSTSLDVRIERNAYIDRNMDSIDVELKVTYTIPGDGESSVPLLLGIETRMSFGIAVKSGKIDTYDAGVELPAKLFSRFWSELYSSTRGTLLALSGLALLGDKLEALPLAKEEAFEENALVRIPWKP
jgi:hypothetical protein